MRNEQEIREKLAHWEGVLKNTLALANSEECCTILDTAMITQCNNIIGTLKWVLGEAEE